MRNTFYIGITGVNDLSGNRGVGALTISTLYLLQKIAKQENLILHYLCLDSNFGERSIIVGEETITFKSGHPFSFFRGRDVVKFLTQPKQLLTFREYLKLDIVLCMGEGDSFSDLYGIKRFRSVNDQHKMARLFRKNYLLLPQTLGPFDSDEAHKEAVKSVEKAALVFTRDTFSFDWVKRFTYQLNTVDVIDVAFFMPYKKVHFKQGAVHVGINISSLLWHGGYTQDNQFGLKVDYQVLCHQIIEYFLAMPDVVVHLVAHVVLPNPDVENDYEICTQLAQSIQHDRLVLAPFFLSPIAAKNYIAGLHFFIGARMHACIAAFSSCVPVFPMAYSRKFTGLFRETLRYPQMADMTHQTEGSVMEGLKSAFKARETLVDEIDVRMRTIVHDKRNLLMRYKKLADFLF